MVRDTIMAVPKTKKTSKTKKKSSTKTSAKKKKFVEMTTNKVDKPFYYEKTSAGPLRSSDVIMGRGSLVALHIGNMYFRYLCFLYKKLYNTSRRCEKMDIAKEVIMRVEQLDPPGRFVIQDDNGIQIDKDLSAANYLLVCEDKALEKTCQALREKKNGCPAIFQGHKTLFTTLDGWDAHNGPKKKTKKVKKAKRRDDTGTETDYDDDDDVESKDLFVTKPKVVTVDRSRPLPMSRTKATPRTKSKAKRSSAKAKTEVVKPQAPPKRKMPAKSPRHLSTSTPARKKPKVQDPAGSSGHKTASKAHATPMLRHSSSTGSDASDTSRLQGLIDAAIERQQQEQEHQVTPADLDQAFSLLPPSLTAIFSGVFTERMDAMSRDRANTNGGTKDKDVDSVPGYHPSRGKVLPQESPTLHPIARPSGHSEKDLSMEPLPPSLRALVSGFAGQGGSSVFQGQDFDRKIQTSAITRSTSGYSSCGGSSIDSIPNSLEEAVALLPPTLTSYLSGVFAERMEVLSKESHDNGESLTDGAPTSLNAALEMLPPKLTAYLNGVLSDSVEKASRGSMQGYSPRPHSCRDQMQAHPTESSARATAPPPPSLRVTFSQVFGEKNEGHLGERKSAPSMQVASASTTGPEPMPPPAPPLKTSISDVFADKIDSEVVRHMTTTSMPRDSPILAKGKGVGKAPRHFGDSPDSVAYHPYVRPTRLADK